ncbi:hypothetical protein F5H01DRAFT_341845 [Linnemannia elongata]|nr:hypothetical protein F5H01DRAFT_341845 [Linnemannia elongata]
MPTFSSSSLSITRIITIGLQSPNPLEHPACDDKSVWCTVLLFRVFFNFFTSYSLTTSVCSIFLFCVETVRIPRIICAGIIGVVLVFIAAIYACFKMDFDHIAKTLLSEIYGGNLREDLVLAKHNP